MHLRKSSAHARCLNHTACAAPLLLSVPLKLHVDSTDTEPLHICVRPGSLRNNLTLYSKRCELSMRCRQRRSVQLCSAQTALDMMCSTDSRCKAESASIALRTLLADSQRGNHSMHVDTRHYTREHVDRHHSTDSLRTNADTDARSFTKRCHSRGWYVNTVCDNQSVRGV